MEERQRWFKEAINNGTSVFKDFDKEFIIYKGFKISKVRDIFELVDVRFSNMYNPIKSNDVAKIRKHGFIKGVDIIGYERDIKRVERYKKRTGLLYDKRSRFKKELPKNKRLNEKRIRNINKRVQEYVDLIFFYQTRIQQFNFKYNSK